MANVDIVRWFEEGDEFYVKLDNGTMIPWVVKDGVPQRKARVENGRVG